MTALIETHAILYFLMFIQDFKKQINTNSLSIFLFRGTLCESVGSAKRGAASGVTEEPSQNCHLFVFEQPWTETAVRFTGQVRDQVYEQYTCVTKQTKKICFKLWKSQRPLNQ